MAWPDQSGGPAESTPLRSAKEPPRIGEPRPEALEDDPRYCVEAGYSSIEEPSNSASLQKLGYSKTSVGGLQSPWSWLVVQGVASGALCAGLVLISSYETIFKKIMNSNPNFDPAALGIDMSLFSLVVGLIVATVKGELSLLFCEDWRHKVLLFSIPGAGFALTTYLQTISLIFLSADTVKVIERTGLLVLAVISMIVFGRRQTAAGWNSLLVVVLSAVCYTQMKEVVESPPAHSRLGSSSDGSHFFFLAIGLCICTSATFLSSSVSCYGEWLLKSEGETPFYMQKFYAEVSGLLMGFFLTTHGNRLIISVLRSLGKAAGLEHRVQHEVRNFEGHWFQDPLAAWDDKFMVFAFVFYTSKSWCSAYLVKQMSSIAKQLCSVMAVGLVYVLCLIHVTCPMRGDHFCPRNISQASLPMMVMSACMMCSVVSYILVVNGRPSSKGRSSGHQHV
mmetsp:Transcript_39730/g.84933  ORF Transcript_39730/g.84933 Transcript_39730/m.84933 type:complete len:449 (+) Transcript_39730:126-1472(+)